MITEEIKKKIRDIVGPENVLDSELDRFGYSYDSSFVPLLPANKPDLVVRPLTTEEVAKVMAVAYEYEIPVTPRGAASGRTGGSIPLKGGISLCLDRMTRIIELDERNMMVTAEAGVRTIDLYNHCAAQGLFYPPDPASWKFSTIGGNVAENAGGMRAVKYGVTTNYVMGLDVVLADGTILKTGGKAIKNVTGYDLKSLFTGSEGTLGIITRVLLRLIPMPKKRGTLQIMFRSLDDGCATVHQMLQAGVVPAAAEIMDRVCLDAVARYQKTEVEPAVEACVVIEIDGDSEAALEAQAKRDRGRGEAVRRDRIPRRPVAAGIRRTLGRPAGLEFRAWRPWRPTGSARTFRFRATPSPRWCAASARSPKNTDFPSPCTAMPATATSIRRCSATWAIPKRPERVHRAVDEIFAAALAVGGTLSGEHGIGITKRPYITQALGEAGVKTLKAVKQALDPKGITESRARSGDGGANLMNENKNRTDSCDVPADDCSRSETIVSQCDRCGACLPVCPLFGVKDIEATSARGKNTIARALAEGGIEPTREVLDVVNFCLLCRACVETCPAKVPTDEAMIDVRQHLTDLAGGAECEIQAGRRRPEAPRVVKSPAGALSILRRSGLNGLFPYGMAPEEYTRTHFLAAFAGPAALGQRHRPPV